MTDIIKGDGYAVGSIDAMGEGYGFRKVRKALDVSAFGVNAVVMPPNFTSGRHKHEHQEELYFVHRGTLDLLIGDGEVQTLPAGSFARVDADTVRALRNATDEEVVYVCVGGKDGYVGRDGVTLD